MTDFVRYIDLKKTPVIALAGSISDKDMPPGMLKEECKEIPNQLLVTIDSLVFQGNWGTLVDGPFDLPLEPENGEIRPTKQGMLFIFSGDSWVMIGSAR